MNKLFYPSESPHWSSIQWKSIENTVSRIQHRIAKATLEGDNRKIRNLQRLLVKSLSARLKAVRQVAQENKGKATPGIDGDLWTTSKRKLEAAFTLRKRMKTKPLRRIYIPKRDGSPRPLGIPTMTDRAKQALWNAALNPVVDTLSDSTSYGFRPYRGCWDAHAQIKVVLSRKNAPQWVLDADIRKCFDTINHDWLLEHTPMETKVLRSWLKSGFLESSGEFHPTMAGTPQGGVISPTLSNHALNGLHQLLKEKFPVHRTKGVNRTSYSSGINIIRYADDFIVTGRSPRQLECVMTTLSDFLKPRGLELHPEKSKIVNIHDGFNLLGWSFKKSKNGMLLCNISKQSIKDHNSKLRDIIKNSKNKPPSALIAELNPVIRGWCNYHRCATGIWPVWNHLNQYLYRLLWKWARKRHPRQSRLWLYDHYWKILDGRRTFVAPENKQVSKYKLVHYRFKQQKIHRIPGVLKVYILDKTTREHIRKVWFRKHIENETGIRKKLWVRQKGLCAHCGYPLKPSGDSLTDVHHIIPKSSGGGFKLSNLELLHEHCHYEQHSPKFC